MAAPAGHSLWFFLFCFVFLLPSPGTKDCVFVCVWLCVTNNCVSCVLIVGHFLLLLPLRWNHDLVPLQWLSAAASEELMVSLSPGNLPPLQPNYTSSPVALSPFLNFQYFTILCFAALSLLSLSRCDHCVFFTLPYCPSAPFSYLSTWIHPLRFTLAQFGVLKGLFFCVSGRKASECNLLN